MNKLFKKAEETFQNLTGEFKRAKPEELFCNGGMILQQFNDFSLVRTGFTSVKDQSFNISFSTIPQPSFNKQFDLLIENFSENTQNGFTNYLFCDNEKQAKRFHDIF